MLRAMDLPLTCRCPPPSPSPTRPAASWTAECQGSLTPLCPGWARRELLSPPTLGLSPAWPMDLSSSILSLPSGGGATCTTAWWGARPPTCTGRSSPPWSTSREVRQWGFQSLYIFTFWPNININNSPQQTTGLTNWKIFSLPVNISHIKPGRLSCDLIIKETFFSLFFFSFFQTYSIH